MELEENIKYVAEKFLIESSNKEILVISHFDTDGITSATIMLQTLKKLDKRFSVKIVKRIEDDLIESLPEEKLILFLDLASNNLEQIQKSSLKKIFIIDHHEITQEVPEKVCMLNPNSDKKEKISGSCLTYLFCRELNKEAICFAKLAVLGMVGDSMEEGIDKINHEILKEGEIIRRRGLLVYPSTRPLNKVLEYCSNPYIPGITGNSEGVTELLREIGLNENKTYKSLIELDKDEMEKLVTSIMLRNPQKKNKEIIGDIFLIKFFNKLEDARELSAIINACSRLGKSELAVKFCMEIAEAKKPAENMHIKYRQFIISGLKFIEETEKIKGNNFVIINAKNNIKDTIIGTLASILSNSCVYKEGTIITTMAYYENKIKVSIRNVGKNTRNLREILNDIIEKIGGSVGGHEVAAGCMISQEKEKEFIDRLKKSLEIELVKV